MTMKKNYRSLMTKAELAKLDALTEQIKENMQMTEDAICKAIDAGEVIPEAMDEIVSDVLKRRNKIN